MTMEIEKFYDGIKSEYTKNFYVRKLEIFLNHIGLKGTLEHKAKKFLTHARTDPEWAENEIYKYTKHEKKRAEKGEISTSTIRNFFKPIRLLCLMNKVNLSWEIIQRTIPHGREVADDRKPTQEEIQKILQYPDKRIKPLVLTMASSGIRLGAWQYLKWKHVTPVERDGKDGREIVAAQIKVYAKEPEEYDTFITPEAYYAIKEWMDHRASSGENVSGESWLMRNKYGRGNVNNPKRMSPEVIKQLIERAMISAGLRPPLPDGVRRYEFKVSHGFRKFFYTTLDNSGKMSTSHIKMLAGHTTGLYAAYSKRDFEDVLNEYLKVVEDLTIDRDVRDEHAKQIQRLEQDREKKDMEIKSLKYGMSELRDKDQEIEELKKKLSEVSVLRKQEVDTVSKQMESMREQISAMQKDSESFKKILNLTNLLQETVDLADKVNLAEMAEQVRTGTSVKPEAD